ncbi:MAG: efflux RND transporter permease subunit [Rhodospirillales bacterium]
MNLPQICINRPVSTILLTLSLLVVGLVGYNALPVNALPRMDFPTIVVRASLDGASPQTMAASVATPLEKQFSTIAGIDSITSNSTLGSTSITLQFTLERNIDAAAQDVQSAISAVQRLLPRDMTAPPSFQKVNPAEAPVLFMALSSPNLPLSVINEYAETVISPRLATLSGVAQVSIYGSQKYAVRVQLNPQAMATRNIGIDEVASAVDRANSNQPTGSISGASQTITLRTTGQLQDAAAYRSLIVATRDGRPIRLEDIGTVIDSVQDNKSAAWLANTRAVTMGVQRQPGSNTIEVVDRIMALLPIVQAQLPASVSLDIVNDRSVSIRDSVHDVQFTLLLTMTLVVMVIFVFLRNLTATAIPSVVLPLSIVGTFAGMFFMGFSIDNISLLALTLAVGFVVDDAIVVLENIYRHIEMGKSPIRAASDGSREIGFTVLSMTISLVAVFIPVLFMQGVVGRLLFEFAVTISMAILVSGILSLTLTPMMASRLLRAHVANSTVKHGRLYRLAEGMFDGLLGGYRRALDGALKHHRIMLGVTFATLGLAYVMLNQVPRGFLPTEDTGLMFAITEAAQDISFDSMVAHQQAVAKVLQNDPNIEMISSFTGSGPGQTGNSGRVFMRLKPRDQRTMGVEQLIASLRPKLAAIPGINTFLQPVTSIRLGGRLTKSLYQYTIQGSDLPELYRWAKTLEERVRGLQGFTDVTSDLQISTPQALIEIDRDKASLLGVTAAQIEGALYSAYGNRQVSTIYTQSNQYWVVLELSPQFQRDLSALSMLYVRSTSGKLVPLDAVSRLVQSVGPLTVNHQDQVPSVTISFNLHEGVSLGAGIDSIKAMEREVNLPAYLVTSYQGTAQIFQASLKGLGWLLLAAVAVIYVVLGMLYEDYIHPLTILSGLPSAGVGALLTLLIFKVDLNVISFIGVIMLIGIVKKNAIMMIDFALDAQRIQGMTPAEAIRDACLKRFRPIMMTTMAAITGTLPIAIGVGAGAELRQPLGLAVVGGLIVSQALTLFITPVVYLYMEKLRELIARSRGRSGAATRPTPAE